MTALFLNEAAPAVHTSSAHCGASRSHRATMSIHQQCDSPTTTCHLLLRVFLPYIVTKQVRRTRVVHYPRRQTTTFPITIPSVILVSNLLSVSRIPMISSLIPLHLPARLAVR